MRIDELILKLQEILANEGNLICSSSWGIESEPGVLKSLEVREPNSQIEERSLYFYSE